jgi:hypothetical protein
MSIPKFTLVENFSWLIQQLSSFDDPKITYAKQGLPHIRGGARRIYRYGAHYQQYYQGATIRRTPPEVTVNFGSSQIECDQWDVSHPGFEDKNLKEKNPKPADVLKDGSNHYTVLVTSKKSIANKTASRYYVSCTCPDFDTTFKEELIRYGYTNGTVPPGKGIKKLAPAICKHIYATLLREYKDVIDAEPGPEESAEMAIVTEPEEADYIYEPEPEEQPEPSVGGPVPQTLLPTPGAPKKLRGRIPKTDAQKKQEYEVAIKKSLKFFSNMMPSGIEAYKNSRQSDNSYKKYKFMVKKYFQGWVIVFTNPLLNPMRDKVREKEIVPVMARTQKGMLPSSDALIVYTKYFTKDELMNMIRSESKPIQQNQIDRLTKTVKKFTVTESLEVNDTNLRNILLEIC